MNFSHLWFHILVISVKNKTEKQKIEFILFTSLCLLLKQSIAKAGEEGEEGEEGPGCGQLETPTLVSPVCSPIQMGS